MGERGVCGGERGARLLRFVFVCVCFFFFVLGRGAQGAELWERGGGAGLHSSEDGVSVSVGVR